MIPVNALSLSQTALSGDGSKEGREDNNAVRLNPAPADLVNKQKIRGRIEDADLTPTKADEISNRIHEEVEGSGEEAK